MRRHTAIGLYITREFVISFVVAFLFFFFIFFMNILLVMAEEIFSRNVPASDVALLVLYSLPQVLTLSFPFAALVGSLMALGRCSSDNEFLALRASGVPLRVVFRIVVILGVGFSFFSFFSNDYLLPLGNLRMGRIYRKIIYTNPGIELEPFSIKKHEDMVMITGAVEGNQIYDFTILDRTEDQKKRVIVAEVAQLVKGEQTGVVSFELRNVLFQVRDRQDSDDFEYSLVEAMRYNIPLTNIQPSLQNPGPREMSSVDVWKAISAKRAKLRSRVDDWEALKARLRLSLAMEVRYALELEEESPQQAKRRSQAVSNAHSALKAQEGKEIRDRSLSYYEFEFHKKFSVPIASLCFFIFALPVGMLSRRSGRTVGFGIGLIMSIVYWALLVAGQTLAPKLTVPAAFAAWLPNAVILGAGLLAAFVRAGLR